MTDVALAPSSGGRTRRRRRWTLLAQQPLIRHLTLALCGAAILYFVTNALSQYNDYLAGEIALYAIALAGLSVLTGISGQISLGHGAFMAVGAYTVALLMTHTQINFILELLISIGTAAVLGLAVGISATRLKGPYLAGMTLLLALALPPIADKWNSVFGGDQGLTTTVPTAPGSINSYQWLAWIEMAGALLTAVLLANLLRSRFGRAFRAVRDDEVAAALAGVHVARTKVTAFVVERGMCRSRRSVPRPIDWCREHGGIPAYAFHPVARGDGHRRQRKPHRDGVGGGAIGVRTTMVDIALGALQSRQRGKRVSRNYLLRRSLDRGHDCHSFRHPRRSPQFVESNLDALVALPKGKTGGTPPRCDAPRSSLTEIANVTNTTSVSRC